MKLRIRNSPNESEGIQLEFQALKDTVWRLTCRIVSLESQLAELKQSHGISGEHFMTNNPNQNKETDRSTRTSRRNYQNHTAIGGIASEQMLVELHQDPNTGEAGDLLQSYSENSEHGEIDRLSNDNDSNYASRSIQTSAWNPNSNCEKRQRRPPPRFGPDGKREKVFKCHICLRMFTRNEHLQDHIRTHQGNQFSCITCGSTFAYKNALRRHEKDRCKTKLTLDALTCKVCHKVFRGKKNLGIHMRVHTAKKKSNGNVSGDLETLNADPTESSIGMSMSTFGMRTTDSVAVTDNPENQHGEIENKDHQMHHIIQPMIIPNLTVSHIDFNDMIHL